MIDRRVLWTVVRTVELEPFRFTDASGPWLYRIEVLQRNAEPVFRTRVWRIDYYEVQPSFVGEPFLATEKLLVEDDLRTDEPQMWPSLEAALDGTLDQLERHFRPA